MTTHPIYRAEYRAYDGERLHSTWVAEQLEPIPPEKFKGANGLDYVQDDGRTPVAHVIPPAGTRVERHHGSGDYVFIDRSRKVVKPGAALALAEAGLDGWRLARPDSPHPAEPNGPIQPGQSARRRPGAVTQGATSGTAEGWFA